MVVSALSDFQMGYFELLSQCGYAFYGPVLLHTSIFVPQDMFRLSGMVMSEQTGLDNLYQMVAYCADMGQSCRRKLVAEHFNEIWTKKQCEAMCDNCRYVSIHDLTQ